MRAAVALAGCAFSTCVYVGLLYVKRTNLPRDHPTTIKHRLGAVAVSCGVTWLPVALMRTLVSPRTSTSLAAVLGLRWPGVAGMLAPVGLTAVLFAVPLVYRALTEGQEEVQDILDTLRGGPSAVVAALRSAVADDQLWRWRNLVIAPISEEWVFRACMAPLLLMAGFSTPAVVLITPAFFGAAHLHHLHDLTHHQGVPLRRAALIVGMQYAYTTMFGWYATWLFLRSGSILPPIAVHALCNWLGVPRFGAMASHFGAAPMWSATALSVVTFGALLGPLTAPSLLGGPIQA